MNTSGKSLWPWVAFFGILAIVAVLVVGALVTQQFLATNKTPGAEQTAPAAAPAAQTLASKLAAPGAPAQPASQPAALKAAQASADCTVKPTTKEGFTKCHEDRLLKLERDFIVRGADGVPTDDSLIAWMKAAGINFKSATFDARQVEEDNIETTAGTVTVVAGIQLSVQEATVKWPGLFTTDRPVDVTGGARSYKPAKNNPSVLYTDVSRPFTGTMTFWADAQNWGQLWPQ